MNLQIFLKILKIKARNNILRNLEYKLTFLFGIITDIIGILTQIIFLTLIFRYTNHILNFKLYDLILYIIIAHITLSIYWLFQFWFEYELLSGKLNVYLTKPINIIIQILDISIQDLGIMLIFIFFLILILITNKVDYSIITIILSIINFLITLPMFILPIYFVKFLSFWFTKTNYFIDILESINNSFINCPITILTKIFFIIFITITPMGYFHWYITTALLLKKITIIFWLKLIPIILLINLIFYLITKKTFKKGLKRYEGFGG